MGSRDRIIRKHFFEQLERIVRVLARSGVSLEKRLSDLRLVLYQPLSTHEPDADPLRRINEWSDAEIGRAFQHLRKALGYFCRVFDGSVFERASDTEDDYHEVVESFDHVFCSVLKEHLQRRGVSVGKKLPVIIKEPFSTTTWICSDELGKPTTAKAIQRFDMEMATFLETKVADSHLQTFAKELARGYPLNEQVSVVIHDPKQRKVTRLRVSFRNLAKRIESIGSAGLFQPLGKGTFRFFSLNEGGIAKELPAKIIRGTSEREQFLVVMRAFRDAKKAGHQMIEFKESEITRPKEISGVLDTIFSELARKGVRLFDRKRARSLKTGQRHDDNGKPHDYVIHYPVYRLILTAPLIIINSPKF